MGSGGGGGGGGRGRGRADMVKGGTRVLVAGPVRGESNRNGGVMRGDEGRGRQGKEEVLGCSGRNR